MIYSRYLNNPTSPLVEISYQRLLHRNLECYFNSSERWTLHRATETEVCRQLCYACTRTEDTTLDVHYSFCLVEKRATLSTELIHYLSESSISHTTHSSVFNDLFVRIFLLHHFGQEMVTWETSGRSAPRARNRRVSIYALVRNG